MTSAWTDDGQYYIWQGNVRIPKTYDPTTKSAIILLGPEGGIAQIPALVKGDPGEPATIDETISFTALAYDDPTPDSATFTLLTPATTNTPPVYRLNLALHKGEPGATGTNQLLQATDLTGTATDGYLLTKTTVGGVGKVTWTAPMTGGQYWPTSIGNTSPSDGQARTLCSVQISPAPSFNYRVRVHGQCLIAGTANTRVDLVARLNDPTSGDIVGRGYGFAGSTADRINLVSGVAPGSASTVGRVSAGTAATVFLRAEQQASTSDTYSTAGSTTSFMVEVVPLP